MAIKSMLTVAALSILAAACGAGDDAGSADLTTGPQTSTVTSTSTSDEAPDTESGRRADSTMPAEELDTTAGDLTTTVEEESETTVEEESETTGPAAPTTLFANTFNFTNGPAPTYKVTVEVRDGTDGQWLPAGAAPGPEIHSSTFYVRFTAQSLDSWGFMTELQINSPLLGESLCADTVSESRPLRPTGAVECIVGPFDVAAEPTPIEFESPTNAGHRQGTPTDGFFEQPILPHEPVRGASVLTFYFVPVGENDGQTITGSTGATSVGLPLAGTKLSGPVFVDCSDGFASGYSDFADGAPHSGVDVKIMAYRITRYDVDGRLVKHCEDIPRLVTNFPAHIGLSDSKIHYRLGDS